MLLVGTLNGSTPDHNISVALEPSVVVRASVKDVRAQAAGPKRAAARKRPS